MKKDSNKDFLLEIVVEDLPVSYIRPALRQLQNALVAGLNAQGITCRDSYAAGTKNILVWYIQGLLPKQEKVSSEVIGPSRHIAFDAKGRPTKQARGFARSQGVSVEDLKIKKTTKGEYVVAVKKIKARRTEQILQEFLSRAIKDIRFPKTMKWDARGFRFARPVKSVLAIFGKRRIEINLEGVLQKKIGMYSARGYLTALKKKILLDPDQRKDKIRNMIFRALRRYKADRHIDEQLLEEVNFMVTDPRIFVGKFDKEFLILPEDVLKASMSKYQRLFPVSKKGHLMNRFIAIIETRGRNIAGIKANYENILNARLQDSLFFFQEDTKKPFSENIDQLKDLIFQRGLGNMFEKIQRLQKLCSFLCNRLNLNSSLTEDILRAAWLSKLDLCTHMVGEFPSLQGVMGGIYALKSGENEKVATAIREHYLPRSTDDALPESLAGAILAVSDRVDNLVGFLGIGMDITGSYDPLGIRRNSQGLIQIVRSKSFRFKLDELLQQSIELYGDLLKEPASELKSRIIGYVKERIEFLVGDVRPVELKKAVTVVGCLDIVDCFKRIEALASINEKREFLKAAKVVERTSNILKGAEKDEIGEVDERLFAEDLERKLWNTYLNQKDMIQQFISRGEYARATEEYGKVFYKVLHEFFDKVLVNTDNSFLRLNRLAMMKAINRLYTDKIANLALLPQIVVD